MKEIKKTIWVHSLLTLVVFLLGFLACWFWGQKTFDMRHTSYYMDTAYRMTLGQWPTRDFATFITPLSFSLLALGYAIFGVSYQTLLGVSGVLAGSLAGVTFLYFSKKLPLYFSLMISLMTILFVTGPYGILWYSSVAVALSYLVIFLLAGQIESSSFKNLFWAGLLSGLTFLAKQNIGGLVVLAGGFYLWLQGRSFKKIVSFLVIAGGLPLVVFLVFSAVGGNPWQEYIFEMFVGASDRKGALAPTFWLPYRGSFTYLLPFMILGWVGWRRAGNSHLFSNRFFCWLFLTSALQVLNSFTSSLDVSSNLSYTPLIAAFFILELKASHSLKWGQKFLLFLLLLYMSSFQFVACHDRRVLYGKAFIPSYSQESVKHIPAMRQSVFTEGVDSTYQFCQQLDQNQVWYGPDCGFLAALLGAPRPHHLIGVFEFSHALNWSRLGELFWRDLEKQPLKPWAVVQGGRKFGLLSQQGGDFSKKFLEYYDIYETFGLFHIYRLKSEN